MYTGSGGEPKREEVGMLRTVFLNAEGHRGAERAQRGGMAPPVCPRFYSKGSALSSQRASLRWKASSQSQRTAVIPTGYGEGKGSRLVARRGVDPADLVARGE